LPFFAPLWKMEKVAENGRKVKAIYSLTFFAFVCPLMKNGKSRWKWKKIKVIALLFCCFLPLYEKWKKWLKTDERLGLNPYLFSPLWKTEKVGENGRKVKAIAFRFCFCLLLYEKWKKSLKMDEKLRL
jgi:hypothetical protein